AYEVLDHDSKNGTRVDGVVVRAAPIQSGSLLRVGATLMLFEELSAAARPLSESHPVVLGRSGPLRAALDPLELAALHERCVTISGSPGSGRRHLLGALALPNATRLIDAAAGHITALSTADTLPPPQPLTPASLTLALTH